MNNNIKTIDIKALSWFDKINGNTYFSALLTINYQLENERVYKIPFRYGYGEQYIYESFELLKAKENIKTELPFWEFCKENNIIIRKNIYPAYKKDCINLGKIEKEKRLFKMQGQKKTIFIDYRY